MTAAPTLFPTSSISKSVLPSTGDPSKVADSLPFGIYASSTNFLSGAADQVAYTYKKLGGDVLDIELKEGQVYAAYEEAVLEYSYLINIHQTKNILSNVLGSTSGTFDHDGNLITGPENLNVLYPKFNFGYARRISAGVGEEVSVGGNIFIYSASLDAVANQQDYDLQQIVYSASLEADSPFSGAVGDNKVLIRKVYYKTPRVFWRFYGYYGGINTVGNLSTYGQYADDSTFEVVPVWQNKLQAMAYEDALYTRCSHYSYELRNNMLRLFPTPRGCGSPSKFWFEFSVAKDPWVEDPDRKTGVEGINNMNTIPFDNVPYENINAIGKQWIRRFALALAKEMLGQIRGKFSSIPIPGNDLSLNAGELLSQGKEEQDKLREELKTILDELTYNKLIENDALLLENASKVEEHVPLPIFTA